jgi:hypothetical protein
MPPRRPPRRGKSYGLPGAPALAEAALKDLRRAHTLMERGEHANAAVLFERQARDAGDRGFSMPAAHLHLQAGRARVLAGESEAGAKNVQRGLEILTETGERQRLAKSGSLLVKDLARLGQDRLTEEVKKFLDLKLDYPLEDLMAQETVSSTLPIKCPKCWAVLRAEDIESRGRRGPVCVYCGSLLV